MLSSIVSLAEELAETHLGYDPFLASYLGVSGYDHLVPDPSSAARQSWRERLVDVLLRCAELESDADDLDSRVLLAAARDHALRALAVTDAGVDEFTVTTLPNYGPSAAFFHATRASITDAASAASYLTRCRGLPRYFDAYTQRLRAAVERGLLPVAPLVDNIVRQLQDYLAHPARDSFLGRRAPEGWDGTAAWQIELERVVRDEIRPALARCLDLLIELSPRSRPPDRAGLLHLPGGVAAYTCCIRDGTTLALDADEVHRLGLTALSEVEQRIAELGSRVLGERSAGAVLARLRADSSLSAAADGDAMVRAAGAIARAEARLADVVAAPRPPPCGVEAMARHLAESGMAPMYSPPARDGSRPGVYLFNRERPGPAGTWGLECAAFHEGVPGHHVQIARLQQVPDLPLLLSTFGVVPHAEGWALYAEQLADEMNLYSDDLQRLGMLAFQALRSVRLVVDTGIHARGWSRARALEFALEHTPMPDSFMTVEIDRYIAWPGQALGYLIGYRELLRLRSEARARMHGAFNLRDFHTAVLDHGFLPLPALSQRVEAWMASAAPGAQAPLG